MPEVFANDVTGTVTSGGTTAPAQGTSQTWTVNFTVAAPVAGSGPPLTWFYLADTAPSAETEKVLVTSCAGGTGSMPVTVTRGANGTTPVAHTANFTVQQVVTAGSYLALQTGWANVLDPEFAGGADPTGGADSTAAIQAALLSFGTLGSWSEGQGGTCYLPPGFYVISKPLIIPSGVTLAGSGWSSQLRLTTGSNCDMIQAATYDSAAQATILGVSAAAIANAFWAGIRDLALHGDAFNTTVAGYHHGINVTTNPLTSASGGDPDFDPLFTTENIWVEACTGDGYFHSGRSGAFLKRVWSTYNNGNAFTFSFDTTAVDCLGEGCGAGFYLNHSSNTGTGNKSYNHNDLTWVSGHSYTPGNTCASAGLMYFCILAVSGSSAPASDATHWTQLTAATSPQATGYGYYWDTNCGEHTWTAADSQENSKGDYYFKGPNQGGIGVTGSSANVNYNNGSPAYNSANPNHYAAVTLDGVSGVTAIVNSSQQASGSAVICTSLNSPGSNTLIATTDLTETAVFSGGTPAYALVNGIGGAEQFTCLSSNYTASNVATAQKVFNATTSGAITLAASTTYEFEGLYNISTSGTTSHQLGILFGGTATLTGIAYTATSTNGTTAAASAPSVTFAAVATVTNVTAAVAAATNNTVFLKGTVRVNAAGTFIPQFQYSAAPGVAPVVAANSYIRFIPVGSSTVASLGNWS